MASLTLLELEADVVIESGTNRALFFLAVLTWGDASPLDRSDDEMEALECTKEEIPVSLLELVLEDFPDSLLAFVEDRFTALPFGTSLTVAGGFLPFHTIGPVFVGAPFLDVLEAEEPEVVVVAALRSVASWLGIMCINGFPILASYFSKCLR